jgi:hypothetical protein
VVAQGRQYGPQAADLDAEGRGFAGAESVTGGGLGGDLDRPPQQGDIVLEVTCGVRHGRPLPGGQGERTVSLDTGILA